VASDVTEDPFCPLPLSEWTWDLSSPEGVAKWESFLQNVEQEISDLHKIAKSRNVYGHDGLMLSCGGAALTFLGHALESTGGRGTWITWRRPNYGAGSISHRDEKVNGMRFKGTYSCATPLQLQHNLNGSEKEAAEFYKHLGVNCVQNRVTLDVIYHTKPDGTVPFLDLATMGELCRLTNGKLMWIRAAEWRDTLREELSRSIQSFVGYDAVFKVRTSSGLQVKSYVSPQGAIQDDGALLASEEINLASITADTCITVGLEHAVGGIKKGQRAYIQTALLYSTPSGHRRVRVSTLAVSTTTSVPEAFRSVDFGAVAMLLTRDCIARLHSPKQENVEVEKIRQNVRSGLYHMCILMLASFKKNGNAGMAPLGQLLLPDTMQLLPLFCMGLMKSALLRPSMARRVGGMQTVTITPSADERAYAVSCSHRSTVATAMLLAYPYVFDTHALVDDAAGRSISWMSSQFGSEVTGIVKLPRALDASIENMEDCGVYLIDSFDCVYLVIGKDVPPEARQSLLNPRSEAGQRIQLLVWQIRAFSSTLQGSESSNAIRPCFPPLIPVVRSESRQTSMEARALDLMLHDAIGGEKDYQDFFVNLHLRINERIQSTKA
jgi:protein transport protein SEC24